MSNANNNEQNWKEKWSLSDSLRFLNEESKKRCKGPKRIEMVRDAMKAYKKYGATFHDYMSLRLYDCNDQEKAKFLTTKMVQAEKKKWDPEKIDLVDNKKSFNSFFSDYMGREWIDADEASFDEFCSFIERHPEFFVKPKRESSGLGINRYDSSTIADKKEFFREQQGKLIEEPVRSHPEMDRLNPESVSFIRVVTVVNGEEVNILASTLRTGGKKDVRFNTAKDDIFVQIDPLTGVCFTDGYDESGNRHEKHPVTGITLKGFQIPNWEMVIDTCKKCAMRVPEVRVIGWDAAVQENGIAFFEGNPGSGVASMQIADGVGKKELFYKYLGEENK